MTKPGLILIATLISFTAMQPLQSKKPKTRNRTPVIKAFTSSLDHMVRCARPDFVGCTKLDTSVHVDASDPDGDWLTYRYEVTGGKIVGNGASVVWSLKDASNGEFTAKVTVADNKGGEAIANIPLTVVTSELCCLGEGICPVISVACPENIPLGQRAVFTATVSGGSSDIEPSYYWKVNSGRIVSGQGTAKIEVNVAENAGDEVMATVVIGGYERTCPLTASCTSKAQTHAEIVPKTLALKCPKNSPADFTEP